MPVVLMLTCGWLALARGLAASLRLNIVAVQNAVVLGIVILFIGLDLVSLARIVSFYAGR